MELLFERELAGSRIARVGCTDKSDGDLSISTVPGEILAARRAAIVDLPWTVCRQVHSDRLVLADSSSAGASPSIADAVIASAPDQVVAAHAADCAPVGFIHAGGAVATAHAGWRGLECGVLESTVRGLRSIVGDGPIEAVVGPHIRVANYEFGESGLEVLASRFGNGVVGATSWGTPGFDLTQAITNELDRLGVHLAVMASACTAASSDDFWSHRARAEAGRFALVAWMSHD